MNIIQTLVSWAIEHQMLILVLAYGWFSGSESFRIKRLEEQLNPTPPAPKVYNAENERTWNLAVARIKARHAKARKNVDYLPVL